MALLRDLRNLSADVDTARVGWFNTYMFGNLGMVNASHNTNYPLILLLPPTSAFISPYKNDETMTCVFHCYQKVDVRTDLAAGVGSQLQMLEETYDKLLNQFKETMQALSFGFEHRYILTGSWTVERINEEYNDALVGIICTVQINKFTHCLTYEQ